MFDLTLSALAPTEADVEIVEHKGIGHPDTMCDAFAESFAVSLARFYRDRFGKILHFNVDKALLVGGAAKPAFGGGEVTSPIQVFLSGRATREVSGVRVPVDEIALDAAKGWVRENMHALDPERHVTWRCLVGGGSVDLVDIFGQSEGPRLANDTSIGVGYAPLSPLERAVLAAADVLRDLARTARDVGEDVKVMGVRRHDALSLTVACAFVGAHLRDVDAYAERRAVVARAVVEAARRSAGREVSVEVNTGDDLAAGRAFLTVTGTSAEAGDDGEVGRGNRVNGLITPGRPMSLEAAAGKNGVTHVGKLYNVAAHRIAAAIVENVAAVAEAHCFLVSRIGHPIDDPRVVDVRLRTKDGSPVDGARVRVEEIVRDHLGRFGALGDEILERRVRLY